MNDLIEIYRRIEYLRNNGLKMKEIADYVDMAPSVLSALYSSVLPTYVTSLKQGHSEEDSLDLALAQVNNVSKKRLLGNLASTKELLFSLEPANGEAKTNPFMEMMTAEMQRSVQEVYNYSGSYLSYSLSSSCQCLKVEPYLIEASEDNTYVKVTHMSAYNTTHRGVWGYSIIIRTGIFSLMSVSHRKWLCSVFICNCRCMIFRRSLKVCILVWITTGIR